MGATEAVNVSQDLTNSHFYAFDFRKSKTVDKSFLSGRDLTIELRPCVYKKRWPRRVMADAVRR